MFIMHMALGGCLKAPPVAYGLTEDTGGHIAYVLGAAQAQARRPDIRRIDIVTRAFSDPALGPDYAAPQERIDDVTRIVRLITARRDYLSKGDLEAELPALTEAFLDRLSLSRKPDVIHAHFADAAELALAARDRWNIPVVYTPHSLGRDKAATNDDAHARRIERERVAITRADAIIVSSRDEAERQLGGYRTHCLGRVHRIDPGVGLSDRDTGTARATALIDGALTDAEKPLILAVARPVPKKNLGGLLDAYAGSPALQEVANLAIVSGQGRDADGIALREEMRTRIEAAGLTGKVAMPAAHDPRDVPPLYRLATARGGVFVNPALHEPFGLTIIEAATAGLPVVATERGGPADIVANIGHGECIDPTDGDALADALLRGVTDRALWRSRSEAAKARHGLYCWRTYAVRSAALYTRLKAPRFAAPAVTRERRLVVCDIDGTLTGDRDSARRFGDWVAAGIAPFAIATGRSLPEARRVVSNWSLPEPSLFITSVGSEIWYADAAGRAQMDLSMSPGSPVTGMPVP